MSRALPPPESLLPGAEDPARWLQGMRASNGANWSARNAVAEQLPSCSPTFPLSEISLADTKHTSITKGGETDGGRGGGGNIDHIHRRSVIEARAYESGY